MGGGLMQLVAYGAQDIYLTGNPQITFFKIVYKRHTNFASEAIEHTFNGILNFGNKLSCVISRNGDLVTKLYVRLGLTGSVTNGKWAWVSKLGHNIINYVELQIGGVKIDRHYGDWFNIWYELSRLSSHDRGYNKMIGFTNDLTNLSTSDKNVNLTIPLKFFCCRHNGLALPIIALQYHDVKIDLFLNESNKLIVKESGATVTTGISSATLLTNYIYLDSDERKRFSQAAHEYLIEQLQYSELDTVTQDEMKYKLTFSHPCKCLYWVMNAGKYITGKKFLSYGSNVPNQGSIRSGYTSSPSDLIRIASIRAVLSQTTSVAGVIALTNTNISTVKEATFGTVTVQIRANTASLTNVNDVANTADCPATVDAWNVVTPLTLEQVSTTVDELFNGMGARTADTDNEGHQNYDIEVYKWDNFGKFIDGSVNPISSTYLQLNGHERFSKQDGSYFNYVQSYETHSNTPSDGINLYSFALKPEDHQPSGTCNFSRIDNSVLVVEFDSSIPSISDNRFFIFTINYNVFRVMSGMGGIAYSN